MKTWKVKLKRSLSKPEHTVSANTWFEARDKGCAMFGCDRDNVEAVEVPEPPPTPPPKPTPKKGIKTPKKRSKGR